MAIKIDLKVAGDRVMVIPTPDQVGLGIVNADGNELVKSQVTLDREEWVKSEGMVFKHGHRVPKDIQKMFPPGSVVIIARHTASFHRLPIGGKTVEFLLVPSAGLLMRKDEVEVGDAVVEEETQPVRLEVVQ